MMFWRRTDDIPETYDAAILKEIWMIFDFITGLPHKTTEKLEIIDPAAGNTKLNAAQILRKLNEINAKIENKSPLDSDDHVLLQLVRDELNSLIKPASGLSVAYTSMVVGNRRARYAGARSELARQAYSGLAWSARAHRYGHWALLALALFMTTAAVWESAKVALGKALLTNIQQLQAERVSNAAEKTKLEAGPAQSANWVAPRIKLADGVEAAFDICKRPVIFSKYFKDKLSSNWPQEDGGDLPVYETPSQHEFCERDKNLAVNFKIAHQDLETYRTYWPPMVGSFFVLLAQFGNVFFEFARYPASLVCKTCSFLPGDAPQIDVKNDVELVIAPVLLVLGNYILPIIFALLGTAAFVVLDFYGKVRNSLLTPSDHILSWIRLVLGLVIGACIGLLYSSYGPQQQNGAKDLIGSLTLSASALAFLAGFGVEAVFSLLGGLVKRVFDTGQAPP